MICVLIFLSLFLTGNLRANNVTVSNVVYDDLTGYIDFDISWENSWNLNGTDQAPYNHDAVWIFIKHSPAHCEHHNLNGIHHALINEDTSTHTLTGDITWANAVNPISAYPNNTGVMIRRHSTTTGTIGGGTTTGHLHLLLQLVSTHPSWLHRVKVFAIEMVQVPQGPFYVGDGHVEYYEYYNGATANISAGVAPPYYVAGPDITADLTSGYLIPEHLPALPLMGSDYPTGFNEFYCMKYEISQGQYADFLNWVEFRGHFGHYFPGPFPGSGYYVQGTWPYIHAGGFESKAMPYMNWGDLCAYLDWAALRPMSELEFEKACRGPAFPVIEEYPWNTTTIIQTNLLVGILPTTETVGNCGLPGVGHHLFPPAYQPMRCGFLGGCPPYGREIIGAGYYGATELGGNLHERVFNTNTGKTGTPLKWGDGYLGVLGQADAGWAVNGSGIRGGGLQGIKDLCQISNRDFNFFSPDRFFFTGGRGVR